jgi:molybdopterin converting factor small subunit
LKDQQEFFAFLIEQAGGKDEVYQKFYRSKIIDLAGEEKSLREAIAIAQEDGWGDWLLEMKLSTLADLINPVRSNIPAARSAASPVVAKRGSGRLTPRQRDELHANVVAYLKDNPWAANADLAQHLGMDPKKLAVHLVKLRKEGKLTAKGERVNMRYALAAQDEVKAVPPVKRKK